MDYLAVGFHGTLEAPSLPGQGAKREEGRLPLHGQSLCAGHSAWNHGAFTSSYSNYLSYPIYLGLVCKIILECPAEGFVAGLGTGKSRKVKSKGQSGCGKVMSKGSHCV